MQEDQHDRKVDDTQAGWDPRDGRGARYVFLLSSDFFHVGGDVLVVAKEVHWTRLRRVTVRLPGNVA